MCDVLYVVFGTAVARGIDLEPYFDKVHKNNMAKLEGGIQKDAMGKVLKPEAHDQLELF